MDDDRDIDVPLELVVLPSESRPILDPPEKTDAAEPVEKQRERSSSGHAPMAGVGESDGDGDSRLKEGCFRSSGVSAIVVG